MKSSRRHDNLIPLSRDHHQALMLCLRIHRGVEKYKEDPNWLQTKAEDAVRFFESNLTAHFKAEEEILFPAMQDFPGAPKLISVLLNEHRKIEKHIEKLRQVKGEPLANTLNEFADILEAHVRKEERELFPIYEKQAPPDLARKVGQEIVELLPQSLERVL